MQGNKSIKRSTSIIDYIFRELAITYLDRHDLAHVSEDDLRHDALGTPADEGIEFVEEEPVANGNAGKSQSDDIHSDLVPADLVRQVTGTAITLSGTGGNGNGKSLESSAADAGAASKRRCLVCRHGSRSGSRRL